MLFKLSSFKKGNKHILHLFLEEYITANKTSLPQNLYTRAHVLKAYYVPSMILGIVADVKEV